MAQEIQNVMKEIRLEKVVLNMGLGKSGDAVEIAKKALDKFLAKKLTRDQQERHIETGESEKENL